MRPDFRERSYPVLQILDIRDGDTYRFLLDVGFETAHFPWLRLKDYSCPELSVAGGADAMIAASNLLFEHLPTLWVTTFKPVGYADNRKSFARYIADVFLDSHGAKLGDRLVQAGHATRTAGLTAR